MQRKELLLQLTNTKQDERWHPPSVVEPYENLIFRFQDDSVSVAFYVAENRNSESVSRKTGEGLAYENLAFTSGLRSKRVAQIPKGRPNR